MVELCQISEHARQTCIVGATPYQPHGKDSIACHCGVTVMRELAEGVEDRELWVRGGEERERQGHGTTDHRITIVKLQ